MLRIIIFLLLASASLGLSAQQGDSWKSIRAKGQGSLVFHWFPNDVEVAESKDIIDGIEHDLALAFIDYLEEKYQVRVELQWIKSESFNNVLELVRSSSGGTFGASSISITPERSLKYNFTAPYMADVSVLMSNADMPIALTIDELKEIIAEGRGISIENTTLLKSLVRLRDTTKTNFSIEKVASSGNVIKKIAESNNAFGYVDLVNFLIALENEEQVKRQFFFPVKLDGLAFIYPKTSDWAAPVSDYFSSQQFITDRQRIVTKYLGEDASKIIEQISRSAEMGPLEEIVLSKREREAQYARLLEAADRDRTVSRLNTILIVACIFTVIILGLLAYLYRVKSRSNKRLVQQQQIIENQNGALRKMNDEKNNLIQVLAHDLRSPLSNIMNAADLAAAKEGIPEDQKQLLGFVIESSKKMNGLINKIMDVDSIETGQHNLKFEELPAIEIVEKVIAGQKSKADNKQIVIETELQEHVTITADRLYLTQVLDNLLSNAIKYSNEETTVRFIVQSKDGHGRISVADQGPGLTEEDKSKIFMKYQRLSAKPTKGELSIGLGLSIVKLFTEKMGGEITFDSILGKGTTFHVDLPLAGK